MINRPAIPAATKREILIESGHRCAVCGESTPLENAHIIPWNNSHDHSPENLICLCANCHQRADTERWGTKTLQEYKCRPWVFRRYEHTSDEPRTKLEAVIQLEYKQFGDQDKALLISAISAVGEVAPSTVKIVLIQQSSVKVTFELPVSGAKKVLDAYRRQNELFTDMLFPLVVLDIRQVKMYVGTIVGESTSSEFRLAVAHETIREQDIIAVDAELRRPDTSEPPEKIRVWAKVQRIECLNPLFPSEAGHELAATQTDPFDTVLSLSREMVTAVCQVLGAEPITGSAGGKLDHLRYPAQPASSAYRPDSDDIGRIVLGDLQKNRKRAVDLAVLSNRPEVSVMVDGHIESIQAPL